MLEYCERKTLLWLEKKKKASQLKLASRTYGIVSPNCL